MLARAGDTVTTVVLVDMLVAAGVAVEPVHLTPIQDEDGAVVEVVQLVVLLVVLLVAAITVILVTTILAQGPIVANVQLVDIVLEVGVIVLLVLLAVLLQVLELGVQIVLLVLTLVLAQAVETVLRVTIILTGADRGAIAAVQVDTLVLDGVVVELVHAVPTQVGDGAVAEIVLLELDL